MLSKDVEREGCGVDADFQFPHFPLAIRGITKGTRIFFNTWLFWDAPDGRKLCHSEGPGWLNGRKILMIWNHRYGRGDSGDCFCNDQYSIYPSQDFLSDSRIKSKSQAAVFSQVSIYYLLVINTASSPYYCCVFYTADFLSTSYLKMLSPSRRSTPNF